MRKIMVPLIVLLYMILSVVYVNAQESGVCGENATWLIDDNGTLFISGSGDMTNYRQAKDVPWYQKDIYKVVIEEGITSIGSYTMSYMYDVKTVEIPTSVTKIEEYAFACNMAESLDLPDGITYIGECAFAYCEKLTDILFPDSVTYVGYHVFSASAYESDESNWEKGILYNNKAVISTMHNYTVHNYVIREGVTVIAESAFQSRECYTISIPDSVQYIGKNAFYSCTSLGNIKIPNGVKEIKKNAFAYCKTLKYIIIPDSVVLIESDAFEMCDALTNVYYRGSEEEWGNVTIKEITQSNKVLGSVKLHYNYNSNISVSADAASSTVDVTLSGNSDYGIIVAMVIKDGAACEVIVKEARETLQFVFGSGCDGGTVKILWLESIEKLKPVCKAKAVKL